VTDPGWIASQFARLSTGLKMLLILSLGLLPLGLIAILASVQSANENRADRDAEMRAQVALTAQRINSAISRSALIIEAATATMDAAQGDAQICHRTLDRLARMQTVRGNYALYRPEGSLICASPGFMPPPVQTRATNLPSRLVVETDHQTLRFKLFDATGRLEGFGEYSAAALKQLVAVRGAGRQVELFLIGTGGSVLLHREADGSTISSRLVHYAPVAGGQLRLRLNAGSVPVTAAEMLMFLLPVMMWIAAALIGWLIVDRLLLRPLVRMQRVVSAYRPGDRQLDMPTLATPAREIGELGQAFDQVTRTIARHEADLEAAVERQSRLVREVHHRVKNNLQVVASLLNLHSRGSPNEEVAAAYASIQRRVDALAVVHRNHYAELEENRGVSLKSLISELGANLRATAPASAASMSISLNIEPYYATQDIAVSVAFLVTEVVEYAMFCNARNVSIALTDAEKGHARLSIQSDSLKGAAECDEALSQRFERIIVGLARQLRSTLERSEETGCYSVSVAVVEKAER